MIFIYFIEKCCILRKTIICIVMKLSQWAKLQGITYRTAWNWFKSGKMPVKSFQTKSGTILVDVSTPTETLKSQIHENRSL